MSDFIICFGNKSQNPTSLLQMKFFLKLLVFDLDKNPEEIEYLHYCHGDGLAGSAWLVDMSFSGVSATRTPACSSSLFGQSSSNGGP